MLKNLGIGLLQIRRQLINAGCESLESRELQRIYLLTSCPGLVLMLESVVVPTPQMLKPWPTSNGIKSNAGH